MSYIKSQNKLAKFLSHVTLIAAFALPIAATVIWIFWTDLAHLAAGNISSVYSLGDLSAISRFAGFILFFTIALIQSYGLLGLHHTFTEALEGRAFSERALSGFQRFAWISMISIFLGIIQRTGLILILSISDPTKQGALSIQFGSAEIKALFGGLLLVFVTHVFADGKHAKDENEGFL